jgi:Domain of unknown function (DUF4288)
MSGVVPRRWTTHHLPVEASERWWAVRVLYETLINDEPSGMFEDAILLVLARTGIEAERKGTEFAVEANHEFENDLGETVAVRFDQVTDVHETYEASIEDGTQVYMSLEAGSDADSLKERGQMRPPERG